ncbi:uncharacterized protein DSM5745_11297 [Aspergillus mulundensis]|uniref:Uncharacterized protein n=1 Tax=Aspergillus mulundensis TaxID=1810919 RepID=A0A3D8Q8C9_9EURO|nr:hypothetical protein DSM5745_11297 [Aspergillus mulundensis]RDW57917.1 hypothetical protein DSM5745_11297 [Aspergillus mulundensis]
MADPPKAPTTFSSHRPKPTLAIPSKRPLSRPAPPNPKPNPTAPTLTIRSAAPTEESRKREKEKENKRIEADFSEAPQPFLDPALWETLKDKTAIYVEV